MQVTEYKRTKWFQLFLLLPKGLETWKGFGIPGQMSVLVLGGGFRHHLQCDSGFGQVWVGQLGLLQK
jgi:hypothetical protein